MNNAWYEYNFKSSSDLMSVHYGIGFMLQEEHDAKKWIEAANNKIVEWKRKNIHSDEISFWAPLLQDREKLIQFLLHDREKHLKMLRNSPFLDYFAKYRESIRPTEEEIKKQREKRLKALKEHAADLEKERLRHCEVAKFLRNPKYAPIVIKYALKRVQQWIDNGTCSPYYYEAWREFLQDPEKAARICERRNGYAESMRQNSPFIDFFRNEYSEFDVKTIN